MKIAIKILRGIITALLLLVAGANLWLGIQQTALHRDPPEIFGYSQLVVTSGSMEPEFSAGDVILIKAKGSYELGDVVTFRDPAGQLVTHRLVGRTQGQFITKGDANNVEDSDLLPPEKIVGGLVTYIPAVGSFLLFLRTPLGLLLLLLLGILLIELPNLMGVIGKKRRGRHAHEKA